jgi:uncharacterized LabA/DUF88 family protein
VGKNVAVFVDVANIFYAAKAAGVDIDYVTLLKSATAGRDFVRAYAYTGLDPDNENQRNFHSFLARNQYKVVSKDIRKYGDGKVKANLDIELVVDLMKTARNLDVAIVVSGDGDFAPAIRAVQEMGVRVEVISFRGNTSSDLIEVADIFTDITQLARVEKGSSRSGRRVAGDDEDLSMTEVPDKQTEGTGAGRGRGGRGRGRGRPGEAEPVAARGRAATNGTHDVATGPGLTALPGEKLSKVAPTSGPVGVPIEDGAAGPPDEGDDAGVDADGRRRRRRRGGRGRGRGRGRELEPGFEQAAGAAELEALPDAAEDDVDEEEDDVEIAAAPRPPRTNPFGSVWDSQLGVPSSKPTSIRRAADDEDFDEPEIPEYLIAEQRRGQGGRGAGGPRGGQGGRGGGGPRGGRAGYNAAVDRERYGRGGGGGINRYPDVSAREPAGRGGRPSGPGPGRQDRPPRQDRFDRPDRAAGPRSSEPWSEVPEELEAMLRAQLAQSPKASPPASRREPSGNEVVASSSTPSTEPAAATAEPATKRRTTRRKAGAEPVAASDGAASSDATSDAPKRRAPRRKADSPGGDDATATAAPKRRTTRAKTATAGTAETAADAAEPAGSDAAEAAAPKRRTTRKKADTA